MMRLLGLAAVILVALGVVAGCGGGDSGVREVGPIGGTGEGARSAERDVGASDASASDAGAALESAQPSAQEQVAQAAMTEVCERLEQGTLGETGVVYTRDESGEWREANPDEAAAILAACESGRVAEGGGALRRSGSSVSVVMIDTNPRSVGPFSVTTNGVGSTAAPETIGLGPREHRCAISVRQQQIDALAGEFSVRFSGGADGEVEEVVEVEGPSWTGEAILPTGGEGIREVRVVVESDAADAEWRVTCSQVSG